MTTSPKDPICDVWQDNLEEEMDRLRELVEDYPYIAMDTEFPGLVVRPIGEFTSTAEYNYQTLRVNVDMLKMIQLGVTLFNAKGEVCPGAPTWQFNFKFDLNEDMYSQDSINLLNKSGINFKQHMEQGIDAAEFGQLLVTSGLVLLDSVHWISFHSSFDFGYLLRMVTDDVVPDTEKEFLEALETYFPNIWDVKHMMRSCRTLKGGLQEVANELKIRRTGPQHQAGSDSLLTGAVFFKMQSEFFEGTVDERLKNVLHGMNAPGTPATIGSLSPSPLHQSNTAEQQYNHYAASAYQSMGTPLYSPPPAINAAVPIMQPGIRMK